jgi:predicted MFS family arabinose efflux permease
MVREVPRDTLAALRVAFGHRPLLAAVLGKTPLAIAGGAGWLTLNLIADRAHPFAGAAVSFGVLQAIRGAGTGIGPAAATWLLGRGTREATLQQAARVIMLSAIVGLAFARDPFTLPLVTLAWGVGTGTNWVLCHVAIQRHAADRVIGRLAAFDELLASVAMAAGAVTAAVVIEHVGLREAALAGAGLGLACLAVAAVLVARAPAAAFGVRAGGDDCEPAVGGASSPG